MPSVVFLRGVNVGGHKKFQPSVLARELAEFDVVSVGAAGTFVVRKLISATKLREEILRRLPFEAGVMICPGRDIISLADLFPNGRGDKDAKRFVSVMAKRPAKTPEFPFCRPSVADWQVKLFAISGVFALSFWRRTGERLLYPNEVVEKFLGVPATTRNWNTIEAVFDVLSKGR